MRVNLYQALMGTSLLGLLALTRLSYPRLYCVGQRLCAIRMFFPICLPWSELLLRSNQRPHHRCCGSRRFRGIVCKPVECSAKQIADL